MTLKEYVRLRLQEDFFRYTLLRTDGKSVSELAGILEITAHGKDGDSVLAELRHLASKELSAILEDEFSFSKIKSGDSFVKRLPEGFGPELIQKSAARFREFLNSPGMREPQEKVIALLIKEIERHSLRNGITNLPEAIGEFLANTSRKAANYRACAGMADYDGNVAREYARANNTDRIIAFRSTLKEAARVECENALYNNVADFLESVCSRGQVAEMAEYLTQVREKALRCQAAIPQFEHVTEYEQLYRRLIPLDFYSRNIDKVDESKAFYIIMMQTLAYCENGLVGKGYLEDGELCFFTHQPHPEPEKVFDDIVDYMMERLESELEK